MYLVKIACTILLSVHAIEQDNVIGLGVCICVCVPNVANLRIWL